MTTDPANSYIRDLFDLRGKSAVVIGGTGTLCGVIAEGLAMAGAEVIIAGRDEEKGRKRADAISERGGKASFIGTDVSRRESIKELLEFSLGIVPGIDILVNGAGINSATPFFEIGEEEFDRIMAINFKAVFLGCQIFGEHMVGTGRGSIINVGSASGLTPISRVFIYSASKGAVHNLSKNLAREWGDKGVRVNTLVPGFFPAEQNRKILDESRVGSIMTRTPMKRFGESRELIPAVLLLASERAGSFITGHEMVVDGGYNAMSI